MVDFARVQKELSECNRDVTISGIRIVPQSDNLLHLSGTIPGPIGTPYEGGTFKIDIILPDGYPFEPPKMQFITKVWHPNISSQNGAICLDILKDQWSPALTLKTALLSLQALLSAPEPDDPQDAVVAQQVLLSPVLTPMHPLDFHLSFFQYSLVSICVWAPQYLRDYPTFAGTARYWTETFAKTNSIGNEEKVQKLLEMGFPEDLVRTTLKEVGDDETMALEKLCPG
ncbi:hypothetical protein HHK36_025232 [Tetracentron sinense]|uniref:E2 ubiquitin-conjugating enzyme n=1 Tax=Tetracentron sinense TaxID=13715 RepID=A0A834YPG8_TETSI|nr:hypothetical protein HHK36_025232 [Tetracentron sinense]